MDFYSLLQGLIEVPHEPGAGASTQGRCEEAEPLYREVLASRREAFGPDAASIGRTHRMLAEDLGCLECQGEAELLLRKRSCCGTGHSATEPLSGNRFEGVEPLIDRRIASCSEGTPAGQFCPHAILGRSRWLARKGLPQEAIGALTAGLERFLPPPRNAALRSQYEAALTDSLAAAGCGREALEFVRRAVEWHRSHPDGDVYLRAQAILALGRAQLALGNRQGARDSTRDVAGLIDAGLIREPSVMAGARARRSQAGRSE